MFYVLFLGHGKELSFYNDLSSRFDSNTSLSWFDNKSGMGVILGNEVTCNNTNLLYEFSGYEFLIENFIKFKDFDKDATVWILNDTSIQHHSFLIWNKIVRNINAISNEKYFDSIYADMRVAKDVSGSYSYAASWMYVLKTNNLNNFLKCLKSVLNIGYLNRKYYDTDSKETFGSHLDNVRRSRLLNWLFSNSRYSGWQYSQDFSKMDSATRVRKGICIEMEVLLSKNLAEYGFVLVDLKSSFKGFIVAAADRLITLLIKIKR